jgi:hypothetical protein
MVRLCENRHSKISETRADQINIAHTLLGRRAFLFVKRTHWRFDEAINEVMLTSGSAIRPPNASALFLKTAQSVFTKLLSDHNGEHT